MISKLGVFTLGFELLTPIVVDIHLSHQRMSLLDIQWSFYYTPFQSTKEKKKRKNPPSVGLWQKSTLLNGKIKFDCHLKYCDLHVIAIKKKKRKRKEPTSLVNFPNLFGPTMGFGG